MTVKLIHHAILAGFVGLASLLYGVHPAARPTNLARRGHAGENRGALMRSFDRVGSRLRWLWMIVFRRKK